MEFEIYKKEIKQLEDKANMMRDMHSYQFQKYEYISKVFSLVIIVLSAIVSILAIADPTIFSIDRNYVDNFRNLIAILAFIIFLISLYDKIYGINEKAGKHEQAVKVMTDFIVECNNIRKLEIDSCGKDEIKLKVDSLQTQYSLINQMNPFPVISDEDFVKAKKKHLLKVEISKKLSNNPHEKIDDYVNKRWLINALKWIKGLLF
ncbi:SLATT domain-containing protein [Methanococcoides sp. SA1]|nr:SLATT domain-containing protein [Methanococcoides sp. SA1]